MNPAAVRSRRASPWLAALLAVLVSPAWAAAQTPATTAAAPSSQSSPALLPPVSVLAGAGALLAGALALDNTARNAIFVHRDAGLKPLQTWANRLGSGELTFPAVVAVYLAGQWWGDAGLKRGAEYAVAGLLVSGAINGVLKVGVGRARPYTGHNHLTFHPVSLNNSYESFPSGHTIVAFSLATALAEETHSLPIAIAGYGLAGTVAWARIYGDNHWLSDVTAGAIISTVATRATILWLRRRAAAGHPIGLEIAPPGLELTIPVNF